MAAYSITGLAGMGTITKEEHRKDAGLFQMPMPASNSSSQILIDLFGTARTVEIGGTFVVGDTGYATLALFIAALDALANGSQTSKAFVSGKSGSTYNGLVTGTSWTSEEGAVSKVDYTISFTEGSA